MPALLAYICEVVSAAGYAASMPAKILHAFHFEIFQALAHLYNDSTLLVFTDVSPLVPIRSCNYYDRFDHCIAGYRNRIIPAVYHWHECLVQRQLAHRPITVILNSVTATRPYVTIEVLSIPLLQRDQYKEPNTDHFSPSQSESRASLVACFWKRTH